MKKNAKGFTLVELIIVLAIMGVLAAILSLSWMSYLTKSRIKTQNTNARVVFNAAQTIVQEYKFSERKELNIIKYVEGKEKEHNATEEEETAKSEAEARLRIGDGDFYFYWDGHNGVVLNADGTAAKDQDTAFNDKFSQAINKIYTNESESVYKIYVNNYIVQSVTSGRYNTDSCLGTYPEKRTEKTEPANIMSYKMRNIDLDPSNNE